jgi:hypothetical protein
MDPKELAKLYAAQMAKEAADRAREGWRQLRGIRRGRQSRCRPRLDHGASVRGLLVVHASRGGTVRVGRETAI